MTSHSFSDKPLVYLAGAMEHAPDNGCGWRAEITPFLTDTLGHRVFDPCIEENHVLTPEELQNFRNWKSGDLGRFREIVRKIIKTDLETLVHKVNYVVCLWDEHVLRGAGTHGELTLAHLHGIPVYMVNHMPIEQTSSWIIGCTTEIFPDFEALRNHLLSIYRP